MHFKSFLVGAACALFASVASAATIPVNFSDTPVAIEGTGALTTPSASLSASITDNIDGTVTFSLTNLTTLDLVTAIFFGDRDVSDFDGDGVATFLAHRFGQAFGQTGVRFQGLKLWANQTFEVTTTVASGVSLGDFADNAIGVLLLEKRTSNLSIFGGSIEVPGDAQINPAPVPLPAGVLLLGSGIVILAARRRKPA